MSMPYRHTQRATVILLVCFAIAVLGVAIAWVAGPVPAFFIVAIQIAVAVVFHSLTAAANCAGILVRVSGPIG